MPNWNQSLKWGLSSLQRYSVLFPWEWSPSCRKAFHVGRMLANADPRGLADLGEPALPSSPLSELLLQLEFQLLEIQE